MTRKRFVSCGIIAVWLTLTSTLMGAESLRGIPCTDVTLADSFWARRIESNRVSTIPHLLRELEKQGSLGGFRFLAGDRSVPYRGYIWGDSDVFKTVEGMTVSLRLHPDPALAAQRDRIIESIAASQEPDGYLFPYLQITEPKYRHFSEETSRTCESYSMGHMIESAVEHYRLTGRTNFLAVARRTAELLRRTHEGGEMLRLSGHPEVELALLKLYEITGETPWLDLAASLVENARRLNTSWSQGQPPLAGEEARGHAVAMLYLFSAATDLARLKGDAVLADLMCRKWTNIVGRKLYLTGGLGHSGHGEGFAADYELPSDVAYCETCAAIANVFWQHRMFLASGDAASIDVLERSLYNNVLAGLSLTGDRFFYVNPLASDGEHRFNHGVAERFAWTGCPCCPVNLVRFIPRVGDYIYAVQGNAVFVNLFAASQARIPVSGSELKLRQATTYPWSGRVTLTVDAAPTKPVDLRLRIPGWARNQPLPSDLYRYDDNLKPTPSLLLNGKRLKYKLFKGYVQLDRRWRAGDVVTLDLEMPVRRVVANPKVQLLTNRVALERGPLVYCAEGADNDGRVLTRTLAGNATLTTRERTDLLGGIVTVNATTPSAISPPTTFIPYYAWCHRGTNEMLVWLPRPVP